MAEIDAFIAGIAGGFISGLCICIAAILHIKYLYDRKIMMFRMQIIGLQAINGVDGDD